MKWHDENTIALHWTVDDVISTCAQRDLIITKEQARKVLGEVLRNHDANYGVSWDTLDIVADMLFPQTNDD